MSRIHAWLAAAALLFPLAARAQQRPHVITGHVTSDSGAVISAADVIVTVAPTAETIAAKSDAAGSFRITIPNPTGEYLLYVGALGRRPFRQRLTITTGDSAVVNVKLASAVTTVAGVQVRARRARPNATLGNDGFLLNPDGLNRMVDGITTALSPDQQGSVDAMASLIPGLSVTGNGVSAFGMGADANMTTLNGMSFGGGAIPRDLATSTSFLTSPWDPTIGGFSGTLASVSVSRGSNVARRVARVTLDAPALQVGDPVAARFGQKFTNLQLGATGSGALSLDKYFYNYGLQASRQTANVSSLLDFDADALEHAGISPDSAFRLSQILASAHIPATRGGIPSQRTTTSANFIERFDRALPNPPRDSTPHPSYSVIVGANYTQLDALSLSPTALPATTGKTQVGGGFLQGLYTRYFGAFGDYVNETAAGVSFNENRGSPYLSLPTGNVLIASTIDGADPTIGALAFGGNSVLARDSKTLSFDIHNQTDFLVNHHQSLPGKLYLQSRYDRYDQSVATNRLGSFVYNSLGDVANNSPAAFTRTLNTPARAGGEWLGVAALGGSWDATKLNLSGGLRVDANAYTGVPTLNPALEQTFGVRNDRAPNSIALSPRLGFTYYPTATKNPSIFVSPVLRSFRSGYQIHGGIGQFRSFLPAPLLSEAIGGTGLPGSSERLSCTGPASPIPDWQAYMNDPSAIPTSCAGGASVFADTVPNATLIDRRFAPSRSWRATLGYSNDIKGNWINIDGVYSLNLNQPGAFDLNFGGAPKFTLGSEGNRPVFVSPTSIVSGTGSASAVESRVSTAFGRVTDRVSDLRSDAKQLTVFVIPNIPFRFGFLSAAYTYADARTQFRGFDGGTATDPRAIEWASQAFTPRHQFIFQAAKTFFGRTFLTGSMRVISGLRYTPIVAGDVNGDGWGGDRAFVFDPSRVSNAALATGLRDLMKNGSASARGCLTAQVNTIAGRSSCVGPWSATMNASLVIPQLPKTNNRVQATINFANPLGGLDQLLHGSDQLRGWGATPLIDGTLYQVRGFDATSHEYLYQVNPRFGATNPSSTTFRTPFRVTLDVRIDYGRPPVEQNLELNMRIKPPLVGTRASLDSIKARQIRTGWSNPYQLMLRFADSIALSRAQSEQIEAESRKLQACVDTMYRGLAEYLHALPPNYDLTDAVKHTTETNNRAWDTTYTEREFIKQLLTPAQIRRMPGFLYQMVMTPNFRGRFVNFTGAP